MLRTRGETAIKRPTVGTALSERRSAPRLDAALILQGASRRATGCYSAMSVTPTVSPRQEAGAALLLRFLELVPSSTAASR